MHVGTDFNTLRPALYVSINMSLKVLSLGWHYVKEAKRKASIRSKLATLLKHLS